MRAWERMLDEVTRTRRAALVGYGCLFTLNRPDAEDLVQEALVRVFARRRSFADARAAEAYVRTAIRTAFLDRARREKVRAGRAHLFVVGNVPGPEAAAVAGTDVRAALATLSPRERACVVLRYFDDLTVPDIAAELGLSPGAVKRYVSDGMNKLRQVLGDQALPTDHADSMTVRVNDAADGRTR